MADVKGIDRDELIEAFEHLDRARTYMNPFEAARDFRSMFDWSQSERASAFGAWTKTFDKEKTASCRVNIAMTQSEAT